MDKVKGIVMRTFKFGNNMVGTLGWDDEQIPELQGPYTKDLHRLITLQSDERTEWKGFEPIAETTIEMGLKLGQKIFFLKNELLSKDAQINEAISIIESGSKYENMHVTGILRDGLN